MRQTDRQGENNNSYAKVEWFQQGYSDLPPDHDAMAPTNTQQELKTASVVVPATKGVSFENDTRKHRVTR